MESFRQLWAREWVHMICFGRFVRPSLHVRNAGGISVAWCSAHGSIAPMPFRPKHSLEGIEFGVMHAKRFSKEVTCPFHVPVHTTLLCCDNCMLL